MPERMMGSGVFGIVNGGMLRSFINSFNRLFDILTGGEIQERIHRGCAQLQLLIFRFRQSNDSFS